MVISMMVHAFYNMMKKGESTENYTLVSLLTKGGEEASLSIADMADDETICGCNGVDKGTIVNAITEDGFTTVEEVTAKTKQGNSCGKCKTANCSNIAAHLRR